MYNTEVTTQDFLNIVLAIGVIVLAACLVTSSYFFIKALKSISSLADNLEETTQTLKNRVQLKFLATIPALFIALASKLRKGR